MEHTYRLVISCPDTVGIVAAVSQFISSLNGWITEASHHSDPDSGWFYTRWEIRASSLEMDLDEFKHEFKKVAQRFSMKWFVTDSKVRKRVLILASHSSHCLADLLYRWHSGDLACEVVAVIANHNNHREMVEWYNIPFHYVPVDKGNKAQHFQDVSRWLEYYQAHTIVLARYMQILPETLCNEYKGKLINIHHSFLPSFVGADPYNQAYTRGVKLIGATCHFVTSELDQGPIIEQQVTRVSHRHNKDDLVRLGKDIEKMVLSSGLRLHLEDRVVIHGNKTMVFD